MISRLHALLSPRTVQVALLMVLAAAAVLVANSEAGDQVAADAEVVLQAEGVVQSAAVAHSSANGAVLIAQAFGQGLVGIESVEAATAALRANTATLEELVAGLGPLVGDEGLDDSYAAFQRQIDAITSSIEAGSDGAALAAAGNQLDTAYEDLSTIGASISADYRARINAIRDGVGQVATAASFVVALIIPGIALVFIYVGLRRRQRGSLIEAELSRERALRRKKDQFLAGASHQINTPLSVVLGFAEMLRDNGRDYNAAVRTEMVELLATQAAEASHVVEDILIAGRADMGELTLQETSIDLRSMVEVVTRDWSSEHRARLDVSGNGIATGDEKRVSQVLRNLLRNAVGHGGTSIVVEISNVFNRVLVEVSDDGEGIPEGQEEEVFQTYFTQHDVDGVPPSLGLGLSVSRRLARVMGGDVKYHRENGMTTFEFSLRRSYELSPKDLPDVQIDPTRGEPNAGDITEIVRFGGPQMVFQPIVDMRKFVDGGDSVIGYEALARFPFGTPPVWFKAAKASDTHVDLELACISAAIDLFKVDTSDRFLALNLSDAALASSRLNESLAGINPGRLILELSEQASISSYEATASIIDALGEKGVRIAVDDIGASEIDLWHVIRLSAQMVKIDISLVRDVDDSPAARGVIRSLVALADELGLVVVAEGVETESEHRDLLELGVEFGQGYLYGKPEPLHGATEVGVMAELPSRS